MGAPINKINSWVETSADMIIDVRSPSEFENDHIPGAINMPVLNDDERAEVGKMYKNMCFSCFRFVFGSFGALFLRTRDRKSAINIVGLGIR